MLKTIELAPSAAGIMMVMKTYEPETHHAFAGRGQGEAMVLLKMIALPLKEDRIPCGSILAVIVHPDSRAGLKYDAIYSPGMSFGRYSRAYLDGIYRRI